MWAAPKCSYDNLVVADIGDYQGHRDADVVICQAVLEHVPDNKAAFASLSSLVRPGGRLLVFVPSRNAAFARINLLMPHWLKRRVLFFVYPEAKDRQGFVSYYDRCTPRGMVNLAVESGLRVEHENLYWSSAYFTFFLPLHVLWRLSQVVAMAIIGRQAAETFSLVLVRDE